MATSFEAFTKPSPDVINTSLTKLPNVYVNKKKGKLKKKEVHKTDVTLKLYQFYDCSNSKCKHYMQFEFFFDTV